MTFGPCPIAATHAIAKSHFLQYRGPEHEGRKASPCPYQLGQIRPSIHALDRPRQTGQDTPFRGVSVMSANVRSDKTPQRSLISFTFFMSGRTNQRKSRTNGHVRACPADEAKKGFCRGGRMPHPPPCPCTIPKSHKEIFMLNPNRYVRFWRSHAHEKAPHNGGANPSRLCPGL